MWCQWLKHILIVVTRLNLRLKRYIFDIQVAHSSCSELYLEGLDDVLLLIAVPLDGESGSGS